MPFARTRPPLVMNESEVLELKRLTSSRVESHRTIVRARILLGYFQQKSLAVLAQEAGMSRVAVNKVINKALAVGVLPALGDLPRSGRPNRISPEAKLWVVELACRKPTDLGYPHETWTVDLLARHVRKNAQESGYGSLSRAGKSLIHTILFENEVKPHRIRYYLEKRDPDFERKKALVLSVYQDVALRQENPEGREGPTMVTVSLDEKPGIQALGLTAPDLPPVSGKEKTWSRDHEYVRLGTLSLLVGLDLVTGEVHGIVRDRHRSREFIELLEKLHGVYPPDWTIRVLCDNHSAHTSQETRRWLATHPGRFEFVFTPKHASWLNVVEVLFSKMARSVLRHMRVGSKTELVQRIEAYWEQINQDPVPFRWKYGIEELEQDTTPAISI